MTITITNLYTEQKEEFTGTPSMVRHLLQHRYPQLESKNLESLDDEVRYLQQQQALHVEVI
jgi:hypothetical protein